MLSLLLDENISPEIVTQITQKRPDVAVISVHSWQQGSCMAQPDEHILTAAAEDGLTLVTYDQKTIMPVLVRWGLAGTDHAGVIFIDNLTIASSDFGSLIRAIIAVWDSNYTETWTNMVLFLRSDA